MCVGPPSGSSRASFIGACVAAAAFVALPASSETLDLSAQLPLPSREMTSAKRRTALIATSSAFVRTAYYRALDLASRIADPALRGSVIELLADPKPYFSGRNVVNDDVAIGAPLYHDAMKSIVFQWNDDGTGFSEATICGTGAHHVLSGAEAIARGRAANFVIALLSAHAAPSLGDEDKVVLWCRAAALLAGVDPVGYGLLRVEGETYRLAPKAVPIEAFVNYLSDHDYVLSVHDARGAPGARASQHRCVEREHDSRAALGDRAISNVERWRRAGFRSGSRFVVTERVMISGPQRNRASAAKREKSASLRMCLRRGNPARCWTANGEMAERSNAAVLKSAQP